MIVFCLGFVWFFLISMQTRIVAFADNFFLHASWTFMVSIVWVFLIRKISVSTEDADFLLYAAGTSVGSVASTMVHQKLKKMRKKCDERSI
jgi:hypothetical protein